MKKVVFITDVWPPERDGVVTSLLNLKKGLEEAGFTVSVIHPGLFLNVTLPFYKDIRLSLFARRKMEKLLVKEKPDYIHLATPGPLGLSARAVCLKKKWKFTTFYHTRAPEYLKIRFGGLKRATYSYLRWFNAPADKMMVSAPSLKEELEKKNFKNIFICPLGVDEERFKKNPEAKIPPGLTRPIFTFLGRIGPEKNIKAFLECDLPGSKLIIGEGAMRPRLEKEFNQNTLFVGRKTGQEMVDLLSISDVFVFPSKTDTFGLSMLEALACGLPVAAYDVPGARDIISSGKDGYCEENLELAAKKCLTLDPEACRKKATQFSWKNSTKHFIQHLTHV